MGCNGMEQLSFGATGFLSWDPVVSGGLRGLSTPFTHSRRLRGPNRTLKDDEQSPISFP